MLFEQSYQNSFIDQFWNSLSTGFAIFRVFFTKKKSEMRAVESVLW